MIDLACDALIQLIGLPLTDIQFAGAMPMLAFGELKTVPFGRSGDTKQVGYFALHLQCPWRITKTGLIAIGADDYFVELTESEHTRLSELRLKTLFSMPLEELVVTHVSNDLFGGFNLKFAGGLILEVVPMSSFQCEIWRLFKPSEPGSHYTCMSRD